VAGCGEPRSDAAPHERRLEGASGCDIEDYKVIEENNHAISGAAANASPADSPATAWRGTLIGNARLVLGRRLP